MSFWVDVHAHLDDEAFREDLPEVLRRASQEGVAYVLTAATSLSSSQDVLHLLELYPQVFGCLGVHPQEVKEGKIDFAPLEEMLKKEKVCAVGEVGLDYYWDTTYAREQKEAFIAQVELAESFGLPLVVHSRRAERDVFAILKEHARNVPVVWHCFAGDEALLGRIINRGWYISLGGAVTYPRATRLQEVARKVPLARLLLETDAPYLPPQTRRGRRNEPAFLSETARFLANLRGEELCGFQEALLENFRRVFFKGMEQVGDERGIVG
jgi:TatD DNase family protein